MNPAIYRDILVLIAQRLPVYDISTLRSVCKLFRFVVDTKLVTEDTIKFDITRWRFTAKGVRINSKPYGLWVDVEGEYQAYIDELEVRVYAERDIFQHWPVSKSYTKEIEKVVFFGQDHVKMVTKYIDMPDLHRVQTKEYLNDKPIVIYDMSEHRDYTTVHSFRSARSSERDFVCYKWYRELHLVLHIDDQNALRVYITKYGLVYDMSTNEFNPFPGCKITEPSRLSTMNIGADPYFLCDTIMSILV